MSNTYAAISLALAPSAAVPQSQVTGLSAAAGLSAALTRKTDAQRSAYTPASGEVVYATDTLLYFHGDGMTVGGVANNLPLTAVDLTRRQILVPRHRNVSALIGKVIETGLTADVPASYHVGHSIIAENGPDSGSGLSYVCASALAALTGVGTQSTWLGVNCGVGGTQVQQAVSYLAEPANLTNGYPRRSNPISSAGWVGLMAARNDAGSTSIQLFARLWRVALGQCRRHNVDAVVFIDPPELTLTGTTAAGSITNGQKVLTTASGTAFSSGSVGQSVAVKGAGPGGGPLVSTIVGYTSSTQVTLADAATATVSNAGACWGPYTFADNASNWEPWADVVRRLAAEHGASVIDLHRYFKLLDSMGVNLIPFYLNNSPDGIHPGNVGHRDMGDLLYALLAAPSGASARVEFDRPAGPGRLAAYSAWAQAAGSTPQNWNASPLSSTPGTFRTARSVQLAESTPKVFVVTSGNSVYFQPPGIVRGVIVDWFGDPSNTGTASLTYNGVGYTSGTSPGTSGSREGSVYYDFANPAPAYPYHDDVGSGLLQIAAVGGQIALCGVTWITGVINESHPQYANRVETGTWSDQTVAAPSYSYSETGRGSSTVGDAVVLTWYGSSLSAFFGYGPAAGKVTYSTDGGSATTVDLYNSGGTSANGTTLALHMSEGWHATTLTVATKNASSSGNLMAYSRVQVYSDNADPSTSYVAAGSGETVQLPDWWRAAAIDSVLSGTPVLKFNRGASTVTVTGGAAVLRMTR